MVDFQQLGRDKFKTASGEEILVSTIYFNLDFFLPVIAHPERYRYYETMVFGGKHDNFQERHQTETEAIEEHAHAVALVEKELEEKV